jgi:hypothetical protein
MVQQEYALLDHSKGIVENFSKINKKTPRGIPAALAKSS